MDLQAPTIRTEPDEMGREMSDLMRETACGKQTKSELLGVVRYEFAPWQIGVVG